MYVVSQHWTTILEWTFTQLRRTSGHDRHARSYQSDDEDGEQYLNEVSGVWIFVLLVGLSPIKMLLNALINLPSIYICYSLLASVLSASLLLLFFSLLFLLLLLLLFLFFGTQSSKEC